MKKNSIPFNGKFYEVVIKGNNFPTLDYEEYELEFNPEIPIGRKEEYLESLMPLIVATLEKELDDKYSFYGVAPRKATINDCLVKITLRLKKILIY